MTVCVSDVTDSSVATSRQLQQQVGDGSWGTFTYPLYHNHVQQIAKSFRLPLFYKTYMVIMVYDIQIRENVKIPKYKPHTNHKMSSVRSHTLAPTSICDLSHSLCWRPLTDLGHISSVTYVCHPLWFVCGHRKGILTSPLSSQT